MARLLNVSPLGRGGPGAEGPLFHPTGGLHMKRSLVVMAALVGLSLLGCGGPAPEHESMPEAGESGTVSQSGTAQDVSQATCSGLPACSNYANFPCYTPGATMDCCYGSSTASLICTTVSGSTRSRWYYY